MNIETYLNHLRSMPASLSVLQCDIVTTYLCYISNFDMDPGQREKLAEGLIQLYKKELYS